MSESESPSPLKILIATPTYDSKLDYRFTESLLRTYSLGKLLHPDDRLQACFLAGEANLSNARNALVAYALREDADILFWIDADTYWQPEDFWKLVYSPHDYITGLCPQKTPERAACIRPLKDEKPPVEGILEIEGCGCGFLKLSRACFEKLYIESPAYTYGSDSRHMLYQEGIKPDGFYISEDLNVCRKWRAMGGHIYADVLVGTGHVGTGIPFEFPK
jgi:glycosyltransferase involved in cell wall biosynthesis